MTEVTVDVVGDHPDCSTSPLGTDVAEPGLDQLGWGDEAEGKGHSHPHPQPGDAPSMDEVRPKPAMDHLGADWHHLRPHQQAISVGLGPVNIATSHELHYHLKDEVGERGKWNRLGGARKAR